MGYLGLEVVTIRYTSEAGVVDPPSMNYRRRSSDIYMLDVTEVITAAATMVLAIRSDRYHSGWRVSSHVAAVGGTMAEFVSEIPKEEAIRLL